MFYIIFRYYKLLDTEIKSSYYEVKENFAVTVIHSLVNDLLIFAYKRWPKSLETTDKPVQTYPEVFEIRQILRGPNALQPYTCH